MHIHVSTLSRCLPGKRRGVPYCETQPEGVTMARQARCDAIDESTVGVYHCINRCVRRAYLCGVDAVSGKNLDHRKTWIQKRLEFLAGQFGIDVVGFSVLSNHFHLILRNRPDVVAGWSDDEVARRWWNLFPGRCNDDGSPASPEDHELRMMQADAKRLQEVRRRLSSISWLMRCLAEHVARRANREEDSSGRFWQGRFRCQRLLDESAILACSAYVDLNPIRADIAKTPETSEYTSAYQRIHARRDTQAAGSKQKATRPKVSARSRHRLPPIVARDDWLSPVELNESHEKSQSTPPSRRASHRGFLPMKLTHYLELLDWTGRQVGKKRRGSIPDDLAPILDRLQISGEHWVELVKNFGRWFHRAIGRPPNLAAEATRCNRRWLHGMTRTRNVFA